MSIGPGEFEILNSSGHSNSPDETNVFKSKECSYVIPETVRRGFDKID
jgi:hypothetical protein